VTRLIIYFSLGYYTTRNFIIFLIITLISVSTAILLREKKEKVYRFFSDMKFKLLYTFVLTTVHILFVLFINTIGYFNYGYFVILNLLFVFIISMLSYVFVKPIHLIQSRKLKKNEKVS
jgi:uncharacterized membrane protein